MATDAVFYSADLPLELANIVTGAHTLDVHRLGKAKKIVGREHLTFEGSVCPHGKHPDKTDEDLAAVIWNICSEDAEQRCKGHARYKIVATYSKPARGMTADPQSLELEIGEPSQRADSDRRSDLLEQGTSDRREIHREYIELLKETTNMAKAVGTMATGLASAWSTVHARESDNQSQSLDRLFMVQQRDGERERMRLLEKSVVPMLLGLQRRINPGAPQPSAVSSGEALQPEIVRISRSLGESLTRAQLDSAEQKLGGARLEELATVSIEPEALEVIAWLLERDTSAIMDVYAELRDDQIPMIDRLQQLASAAGDAAQRATPKA